MGKRLAGEVVVLPFPQTNLQAGKRRPALVVAELTGDDVILCQITRQARSDNPLMAQQVVQWMGQCLGWSAERRALELERYERLPYLHQPLGHRDPLALRRSGFLHE